MKRPTKLFIILATVTAVYSLFSVILMSDVGQFIALPKSWIITYYKSKWIFGGINIVLLVFLWHQHVTSKIAPRWLMVAATAGVLGCIFAANVLNVLLFPRNNTPQPMFPSKTRMRYFQMIRLCMLWKSTAKSVVTHRTIWSYLMLQELRLVASR